MDGVETPAGFAESGRMHYLYARKSDPEIAERIFDPLSLDPDPWPPPRELPWLRWYRVTFAVTCVLGLYLVGRRWRQPNARLGSQAGSTDPPTDDADVRHLAVGAGGKFDNRLPTD